MEITQENEDTKGEKIGKDRFPDIPLVPASDPPLQPTIPIPNPNPPKEIIGEINTKKIVEEKRKVNILSSEDVQERMKARTEQEIKFPPKADNASKETLEEYRARIQKDAADSSKGMTPEKFKSLAGSLIQVFDFIMGAVLRRWGLDTKDSGYSIENDKKNELTEQLTNILVITNTMFPIGMVFLVTLIAVYITPVMNAYNHRQEVLKIREEKRLKGLPLTDIDPKTGQPKKKRGGQPKG